MNKQRKYNVIAVCVIATVILLDQLLKIWVKTHLALGECVPVLGNWFNLHFVENEGMAFGISLGQNFGKLMLSLLRIALVVLLCWYTHRLIKRERMDGLTLAVFSLVIAGALGNIIDSLFYGLIFNNPPYPQVAEFQPWGYGYGEFLYGKVVDMFYFPLIEWDMPTWMPIYSGEHCVFFSPIFNFADAAISCGIVALLLFYHKIVSQYQMKR